MWLDDQCINHSTLHVTLFFSTQKKKNDFNVGFFQEPSEYVKNKIVTTEYVKNKIVNQGKFNIDIKKFIGNNLMF